MALQSILSQESLEDADIDKVKKLSIGNLLTADLYRLRTDDPDGDGDGDGDEDGDEEEEEEEEEEHEEEEGFSMINESDHDENVAINPLDPKMLSLQLSLPPTYDIPLEQEDEDHLDSEDEESEDEDDMKEISPLAARYHHRRRYKAEMSDTRMTLQIPNPASSALQHQDRSLSVPPSLGTALSSSLDRGRSLSPRHSVVSLSRRSSSIFQMLSLNHRASQIASGISKEHIHKFHSVTHHDNEILLLSTKLLILLTVCVISSFCSFLVLFGIFRVNQNNGIFFVYGIDSFINIWCLALTFKFSAKLYDMLFNCGNRRRATKFCFPMVKTVALTWKLNKLCFCHRHRRPNGNGGGRGSGNGGRDQPLTIRSVATNSGSSLNVKYSTPTRRRSDSSRSEPQCASPKEEGHAAECRMSCFFCCGWGDEEVIQIYHMAKGEVELMLLENAQTRL